MQSRRAPPHHSQTRRGQDEGRAPYTNLDPGVAIKILPAALAQNPDRWRLSARGTRKSGFHRIRVEVPEGM